MDICLVNLPYRVGEFYAPLPKCAEPLNLATLATPLLDAGHQVRILDLQLESIQRFGPAAADRMLKSLLSPDSLAAQLHSPAALLRFMADRLQEDLRHHPCDLLGVNGDIRQLCLYSLGVVKGLARPPATVVGGHLATASKHAYAADAKVDYVVLGEGEQTLSELVECLERGHPVDRVAGLCFQLGDDIKTTAARGPMAPQQMPAPARHLLHMEEYHRLNGSAALISSRGCVGSCTFCGRHLFPGQRFAHVDRIVDEIEQLQQRYGVEHLVFYDNTINGSESHLTGLCQQILSRGLEVRWTCLARLDSLTQETIQLMRQAGCEVVSFGVESGSSRMLEMVRKKIDLDEAKRILKACRGHGITTRATFIYDLPDESIRDLAASLRFIATAPLDLATFWPLRPSPMGSMFRQPGGCQTFVDHGWTDKRAIRTTPQRLVLLLKDRFFGALNYYYQRKTERVSEALQWTGHGGRKVCPRER